LFFFFLRGHSKTDYMNKGLQFRKSAHTLFFGKSRGKKVKRRWPNSTYL
jgi:hypothetical protein